MATRRRTSDKNKEHPEALAARARVPLIIDSVAPVDLVSAIKRAPSLRGMILGYIAEEMFEKYLRSDVPAIDEVHKHDDHNREENKSDRSVDYRGRRYTIQLKSIQTNSIAFSNSADCLVADVQNDASDRRNIPLPNGNTVHTTCYKRGEYDILAVPLFPFIQRWDFAYKLNRDCRTCTSKLYEADDLQYLLSTMEKIQWPLDESWTTDLISLLDPALGSPIR
jgi:hypothetical protein